MPSVQRDEDQVAGTGAGRRTHLDISNESLSVSAPDLIPFFFSCPLVAPCFRHHKRNSNPLCVNGPSLNRAIVMSARSRPDHVGIQLMLCFAQKRTLEASAAGTRPQFHWLSGRSMPTTRMKRIQMIKEARYTVGSANTQQKSLMTFR